MQHGNVFSCMHLCVCFCSELSQNFHFWAAANLHSIWVKFVDEGYQITINVTGAKKVKLA